MKVEKSDRIRVLIAHATYQQRGGEDAVAEAEEELLRSHGHEVKLLQRDNQMVTTMSRTTVLAETMWSNKTTQELGTILENFRPDVIHVHNTFPLISPAIYWAAAKASIPIVQTLHNFRLLCPQAMFLRDGKICEDCLGKVPWRGATRACYHDSKVHSGVVAAMVTFHRAIGTWQHKITRYIALNNFCRDKFIQGGLPQERIVIKPNFVKDSPKTFHARSGFLFVGRLSPEKGIKLLSDAAAQLPEAKFRVAGEGPEAASLDVTKNIMRLGRLPRQDVQNEMAKAVAVVVPSICYETFGLVIVEAFANGTPVIASNIGALSSLVKTKETGLLFEPGNSNDLVAQMAWALQHPNEMAEMGCRAREHFEKYFTADLNYRQLIEIYQDAIEEVDSKGKK